MKERTLKRLLRATAAIAALAAAIIGLPIALTLFGQSPLEPGDGTIWERLVDQATKPVSDTVLLGLLTLATWVGWAVFTAQVVLEVAAAAGASVRYRVPAPGFIEVSARRLVTAITMSVTLAGPITQRATATLPTLTSAPPAAAATFAPADQSPQAPQAVFGPTSPVPVAAPAQPTLVAFAPTAGTGTEVSPDDAGSQPFVTVAPADTPWALAERHLGSGLRWHEIWDLNCGKPQPDGQAWITEDLIQPGWQFALPADATNLPAPQPQGSAAQPTPRPTSTSPGPAPTPAPPGQSDNNPTPDGHSDTNVAPAPPEATEPPSPTTTSSTTRPTQTAPDDTSQPTNDGPSDTDSRLPIPLLGTAATLLAAGVVRQIRRARTRRNTSLPAGAVAPRPPRTPIDRDLYEAADEDTADRLDVALAHLATRTADRPGFTAPRVIQLADQRIDILLDRADPKPPKPWRAETAGLIWVLDPNKQLEATDAPTALPTLVTVGTGESHILIDLETYGVVSLVGDHDGCKAMARSMVTELAARNDVAPNTTIIANALDPAELKVNGVNTAQAWTEQHVSTVTTVHAQLDATGWASTWQVRAGGQPLDGWPPNIWFTTHQPGDRYYQQAIQTVADQPGTGSAIVVIGKDPGSGLHIRVNPDGTFEIPDHRLDGQAQLLDTAAATQIAGILEHANDTSLDSHIIEQATSDHHQLRIEDAGIATATHGEDEDGDGSDDDDTDPANSDLHDDGQPVGYEDPEHTVLVRVCGPIRIDGSKRQLYNPETAATTYIALNGTTDLDTLRDVVWRGAVSAKRARNSISNIRGAVGEGITWTPQGRLTTGPGLTTDLELIKRRLRHAQSRPPAEQIEILEGALQLVTGRTCTYPTGGQRFWKWIDLDDWMAHVDPIIGTLGTRLATLHLQQGDGQAAAQVAQRGIEASGQRDDLVILQVTGHELNDDKAAARGVIRRYEQYLNDLGVDEHNEELLDLFDRYAD